jgi:hypothetical protein
MWRLLQVLLSRCVFTAPLLFLALAAAPGARCQGLLHGLLLEGLQHGDLHCRQRAVHLLEACVAAGCAPHVSCGTSLKLNYTSAQLESYITTVRS